MSGKNFLSLWVKRFLLEYVVDLKNLSKNTQHSYRDTFRLYIPFLNKKIHKPVDQLIIEDMSAKTVKEFLLYLESSRKCSITTRNQRLAALHSFSQFVGYNSPEHLDWYSQIHQIPFKKARRPLITYLEKNEMDALLNSPDLKIQQGKRDHAILLFLYNTGARADEVAQLIISDLDLAYVPKRNFSSVLIRGKGNKLRHCPLWPQTVKELNSLIINRNGSEPVFLNRYSQPFTRFGIYDLIRRYAKKTILQMPSLNKKHISPHTIRHTTATHLLRAGVDINTIRVWLGHVSINTTNIYAEIDIEMKAKMMACCEITEGKSSKHCHDNNKLMKFLKSL